MKIATWNVDRPKLSSTARNDRILKELKGVDADILILSETNSSIHPGEEYCSFPTVPLLNYAAKRGESYGIGENRVTVWTKYKVKESIETSDPSLSTCVVVTTPFGDLIVYGTVIGVYGNRDKDFIADLEIQSADWRRISKMGNVCLVGDFNMTLGFDNYYYTKEGRLRLSDCFRELAVTPITQDIAENIDHIAIANALLQNFSCSAKVWNRERDRGLSDHMGVWVELTQR